MPNNKLTPDERRDMVLALLSGESATELSKRYGVARSWVYAAAEEAKTNPKEKFEEAEKELLFRDRIIYLIGE